MKMASLRPGSTGWLFLHELRMFFYDMGSDVAAKKSRRGMPLFGKALIVFVLAAIHYSAWELLHKLPPLTGNPPPVLLMASGMALLVLFSLMLSMALNRSVGALFERGDLDLLLSSPVDPASVFTVRLGGIVLGVAFLFLLFLSPFAHIGLVMGQARWLGIYPAILALAVFASSFAMMLTLLLVRLIGARRTKTAAHMLSALAGATLFLISQFYAHHDEYKGGNRFATLFEQGSTLGADSWLWYPARALFGDWHYALPLAALALAVFYSTVRLTHGFFLSGVQQASAAGGSVRQSVAGSKPAHRFGAGLFRITLIKEWRLLLRDPQLLSQIVLQLVYLLPAMWIIFKNGMVLPSLCAVLTYLAISITSSLVWVVTAAEEAPDLLLAAPVPPQRIRLAKLTAALLPVTVLMVPALCWLCLSQPLLGLATSILCMAGMISIGLIHGWLAKPGERKQFNRRNQGSFIAGIVEMFNGFAWAGAVYFALSNPPVSSVFLLAGAACPAIAWLLRKQPG